MCEYMWLEIGRLGELFIATIKGANIGSISSMDTNMGTKVEV